MGQLIAVIIPCYNVKHYINACLQSVLDQKLRVQIICVDNGSNDGTLEYLEELQKDIDFTLLQEKKRGAGAARNKGLEICDAEWVQFLDADDLLLENKLRKQLSRVTHNTNFVVSNYIRRSVSGDDKEVTALKDIWKGLFSTRAGITSAALFKTAAVKQVHGWDENLASSQEYDLMFRMMKRGGEPIIYNASQTVIQERSSGQISQSDPAQRWARYIALRIDMLKFIQERHPDYFEKEKSWYHQALFDQIRILYPYDGAAALKVFSDEMPEKFKPVKSSATSRLYVLLFWIFGFKGAEAIRARLSRK